MSAGHYENFPVASRLVPAGLRPAVLAIYRFARAADDVADEGDAPAAQRLAELERFDRELDAIAAGATPTEPPFADLAVVVRAHALPLALFHDLVAAFRHDLTTTRYDTVDALYAYCRRSANPVGRLVLHLYRAATPANLAWSDAICTALQCANFWQDVAVDWRKGRVYIPREDLGRFGIDEAAIGSGLTGARWRELMRFETARTRALLESGRPLTRALRWLQGLELAGVLAGAHRILDRIDAVDGDVFRRRPALARGDWAIVAFHALFPPRRHRALALASSAR